MERVDWRRLGALTAFAVAMGHLEAVVVVYIRHILNIVPTPEQLDANVYAQVPRWIVTSEQWREASTIIMLLSLAYLVGRKPVERLGVFLFAFGVWDIFYYVALKVLIGWPASLRTMDLLFLIPKAWFAPVWVPVGISAVMVVGGLWLLARGDSPLAARGRAGSE
ncbi:MAG: hypothetical protein ABFD96_00695 [Armatimonadia bacterium]